MKKDQRGGRVNRVNSQIQQIIADDFIKSSDSVLNSLTVSYVDTSIDMKKSTVFVTVMGNNQNEAEESLNRNRGKIQKSIGDQLAMKFTPKLLFKIDTKLDSAEKINKLLNTIGNE